MFSIKITSCLNFGTLFTWKIRLCSKKKKKKRSPTNTNPLINFEKSLTIEFDDSKIIFGGEKNGDMETGPILSLSQFEFADRPLSSSLRIGFSGIGSSCADLRQLFHYDEGKGGGLMIAIFVPLSHGKISISPEIYRPPSPLLERRLTSDDRKLRFALRIRDFEI